MKPDIRPLSFGQSGVVAASVEQTMAAFSSPDALRVAIPHCKEVRRVSDRKFWVIVRIGVLNFSGEVGGMFTMILEENKISMSGDLRTTKYLLGRMNTALSFSDQEGSTLIESEVTLIPAHSHNYVIRKAAQVFARKLMKSFFKNLHPLAA